MQDGVQNGVQDGILWAIGSEGGEMVKECNEAKKEGTGIFHKQSSSNYTPTPGSTNT